MQVPQNAVAVIILAAGNSSRLGEPKQLLTYQNKTLIRHIAETAVQVAGENVFVVTGSSAALITDQLSDLPCQIIFNPNWPEGMASSIAKGITVVSKQLPGITGCILAVSDQPFVTVEILQSLIAQVGSGVQIVASSYGDTVGTPVFFPKIYFPELLQLQGSEGAKKLIMRHSAAVSTIPFPLGTIDIDTKADYQNLLGNS